MPKGEHLGEFEHIVLLALLRLKDEGYGMRVRQEIQSRATRTVSIGSVYATLDRLQRKGLVRSSYGGAEGDEKGRARKFFHLTPEGAQALREKHDLIARMIEGLAWESELESI